jgi:hypothetical protein
MSSQMIDLPPLRAVDLRKSIKEAFTKHCGETVCIASTINGGGKTHYIQSQISHRQRDNESLLYCKVPIRESTSPNRLIELMTAAGSREGNMFAFHLDIGHVIPLASNTILFQLLFVGVLRDPLRSRAYYKSKNDLCFIEIPNSPNNRTAEALRFCCLLPTEVLQVTAAFLDFNKPVFTDLVGTLISTPEYSEMVYVCKWLRAIASGKLKHGDSNYIPEFSPWEDEEISEMECFELLCAACCRPDGPSPHPSWAVFHSFVVFMNMQFTALQDYPLLQGGVLSYVQGLEHFKEIFIKLLIETSKDFSLRSVPQLHVVGPPSDSVSIVAEVAEAAAAASSAGGLDMDGIPLLPPTMRRERSAELRNAEMTADYVAPAVAVRQSSEEVVARFRNMISWEQSEHPIVAFKMDSTGRGVSGMDIISLNRAFLAQHIPQGLMQVLEANRFQFDRDWSTITNEEGAEILRSVDGLGSRHRGGIRAMEPGYVMTVDNMLKMLSIQLRLRFNLPVIIMGETGCGEEF